MKLFGEIKDAEEQLLITCRLWHLLQLEINFQHNGSKRQDCFDNPTQARLNLPNRPGYTMSRNGMLIKSPLAEEIYTNPMNGKFTSTEFELAIKFAEEMPFDGFMKESIYRYGIVYQKELHRFQKQY